MPVTLGGGFNIISNELVDNRFIITSSGQRFTFAQARMGNGLTTYASESGQYFILVDSSSYTTDAGWRSIAISDAGNTSSFQFTNITASHISGGSFSNLVVNGWISASSYISGSSGSFGAVAIPEWGDLSASLAFIKAAAGAQDLESVLGIGNYAESGAIMTTLTLTGSQNISPVVNRPALTLVNGTVNNSGKVYSNNGLIIFDSDIANKTLATIEAFSYTPIKNGDAAEQADAGGAFAFRATAPGDNVNFSNLGFRDMLFMSHSGVSASVLIPGMYTGSSTPQNTVKNYVEGLHFGGGSGSSLSNASVLAPFIAPYSQSKRLNLHDSTQISGKIQIGIGQNQLRFGSPAGESVISASNDGVAGSSILKLHSQDSTEFYGGKGKFKFTNGISSSGAFTSSRVIASESLETQITYFYNRGSETVTAALGAMIYSGSAFYLGIPD